VTLRQAVETGAYYEVGKVISDWVRNGLDHRMIQTKVQQFVLNQLQFHTTASSLLQLLNLRRSSVQHGLAAVMLPEVWRRCAVAAGTDPILCH
jgi:hypothetical protein